MAAKPLRIGFLGLGQWGLATMEAIAAAGHELSWVITHPDGDPRFQLPFPVSLERHATRLGTPIVEAVNTREEAAAEMPKRLPVDLVVSSNWRTHIQRDFFEELPHGGLNVHRSLLPRYGGFAPLNWAVANGEEETGVSVHALSDELDTGMLLGQRRIEIGPSDTATDLFHRSGKAIAELIPEVLDQIASGRAGGRRQDLSAATFFHERTRRDRRIDWSRPAHAVDCLVRAQSDPFPNAFAMDDGSPLAVKRCTLGDPKYRGTPGRVVTTRGSGVVVICGEGGPSQSVLVTEVAADGGEPLEAAEYFRASKTRYLE